MMTNEQLFRNYSVFSRYFYLDYRFNIHRLDLKPVEFVDYLDITIYFNSLIDLYGIDSYYQMKRYYNSRLTKLRRLRKRVTQLLNTNNAYLVTLTFSDRFIDTDIRNKRQWATRFLNRYSNKWLFNSDFGDLNNRHHFHCIVADPCDYFNIIDWPYGWIDVRQCDHDSESLSGYVDKISALSMHAVKQSSAFKISYSRSYKWL